MTPEQIETLARLAENIDAECAVKGADAHFYLNRNDAADLRALLTEWEELTQMMQRIAEDVLPDPVRYADLTPEVVRDCFIRAWCERSREIEDAKGAIELLRVELVRMDELARERGRERDEAKLDVAELELEVAGLKAEIERLKNALVAASGSPKDRDRMDVVIPLMLQSYRNRAEQAEAKLAQVVELHRPVVHWRGMGHDITACNVCGIEAGWPCATMKALARAALAASPEPSPVFCHAKTNDNRMCCGLPLPCPDHPREPAPERWRCEACGVEFDHEQFSHSRADHAPGCRGDCRNCPVEVQCGPISRAEPAPPEEK